jgi:hypothetical protein
MDPHKFPCSCCGYRTLKEAPPGTFQICPVCFWEDDDTQVRDLEYAGGANAVSLLEARRNFADFGAISPEYKNRVRPPSNEEREQRDKSSAN